MRGASSRTKSWD
ncbi:hypothetical protein LINPERPRIM_LOCUS21842 [Linum perenne]